MNDIRMIGFLIGVTLLLIAGIIACFANAEIDRVRARSLYRTASFFSGSAGITLLAVSAFLILRSA